MKEEILSFSLHYVGMAMILPVISPFVLQPHHILPEEHVWMRIVSENVYQVPNEEPKVNDSSSCKDEAEPHVVWESIVASKVKEH